jgi:hypothetical protein
MDPRQPQPTMRFGRFGTSAFSRHAHLGRA